MSLETSILYYIEVTEEENSTLITFVKLSHQWQETFQ